MKEGEKCYNLSDNGHNSFLPSSLQCCVYFQLVCFQGGFSERLRNLFLLRDNILICDKKIATEMMR